MAKFTIYTVRDIQKKLKCSSYTAYKRVKKVATKYGQRWLLSAHELDLACRVKVNKKMQAFGILGAATKAAAKKKKKKKTGGCRH